MEMKTAVEKMVASFGPADKDLSAVTELVMRFMPKKDVPDEALRKIMVIGKSLKKLGVK